MRSALTSRLGGIALALTPLPRGVRYRLRLRAPHAAHHADRISDRAAEAISVLAATCLVGAALPERVLPSGLQRFWLVGATLGLVLGIPFALERRGLRRRLADMPPAGDALRLTVVAGEPFADATAALAAGDPERAAVLLAPAVIGDAPDPTALALRALAAAAVRDSRTARAFALRAVQVDERRWDVLARTGLALCQHGGFAEGVRLLERAALLIDDTEAELMLAQGLAAAGRLREAVAALDRATGRAPLGRRP